MNINKVRLIFEDLEIIELNMCDIKNFSIGDTLELQSYYIKDVLIEEKETNYFYIQVKNINPSFKRLMEKYTTLLSIEIIYDNKLNHKIYLPKDIEENEEVDLNKYITGFYGVNNCLNIVVSKTTTAKEVFVDIEESKGLKDTKIILTDDQIEIIKDNIFLSKNINLDTQKRLLILELDEDQYKRITQ